MQKHVVGKQKSEFASKSWRSIGFIFPVGRYVSDPIALHFIYDVQKVFLQG